MGFFHSTLMDWLNLIVLIVYAGLTYIIASDTQKFFVSFMLQQEPKNPSSKIIFSAINNSKSEVEVFSKVWSKVNGQVFTFKKGFYANSSAYPIQPFSQGGGSFDLNDLTNNSGMSMKDFVKQNNTDRIEFKIQIHYKKTGGWRWKKSSPLQYVYYPKTNVFWLDV